MNQKIKSSVLTKRLIRARKALALEQLREPLNLQVGQTCGLAQSGLSGQIEANLEKDLVALSPQAPNESTTLPSHDHCRTFPILSATAAAPPLLKLFLTLSQDVF